MEIKGSTTYTAILLRKMMRTELFRSKVWLIPLALCEMVACFLLVFLLIIRAEITLKIILLCISPLVLAILLFTLFPVAAATAQKALFGTRNDYVFSEDGLTANSNNPTQSGEGKYLYGAFIRVIETKDTFYLYISKAHIIIVEKGGITKGSSQELRALLEKHVTCKILNR